MAEPTKAHSLHDALPIVVMAAMHTTTISASMTAYSTAVGPSSAFRNDTRFFARKSMSVLPSSETACLEDAAPTVSVGNQAGGLPVRRWPGAIRGWPLLDA